ncbi:hypothetical protein CI15_06300 [Paraburkholderia monticola]|uniref:Uncharacterized protein n=1 Tax=Paraburkholderia monticola TaxID=1399968 RepID=A0A149PXL3_9BURK|nr:hypothetical protein [Paraburkholderia monticola]KXU89795.1 hypothetical protein CI15_06300 [Paraburkholderia monticola]
MLDLRFIWNLGAIIFSVVGLPIVLFFWESAIRVTNCDTDLKFLPPELASAGLALLLVCFPIGEKPESGTTPEARRACREYNWNATLLILAVFWFAVGSIFWVAAFGYSIKGTYPAFWLKWSFGGYFKELGAMGTDAILFYCAAGVLASGKMAKT